MHRDLGKIIWPISTGKIKIIANIYCRDGGKTRHSPVGIPVYTDTSCFVSAGQIKGCVFQMLETEDTVTRHGHIN